MSGRVGTRLPAALRRLIGPAVVSTLFAVLGLTVPAVIVAVVGVVLLIVGVVRPGWGDAFDRALGRVGAAIAAGFSWAALGAVWALAFAPAWAIGRLLRREPLRPQGTAPSASWVGRSGTDDLTTSTFVTELHLGPPPAGRWRWVAQVPRFTGWVVIVLALNYGIGWTYDEFIGSHDRPDSTDGRAAIDPAALAATPALDGDDWAEGHFVELNALPWQYEPYVLSRIDDTEGATITIRDGARVSHLATAAGEDQTEVWFFGGGTAFGAGQRDEHTVPSAFARAAAAAGDPVRVVNLAVPGHTIWQQWQRYERRVADEGPPDMRS
ncbi:MAG: hypothetical protein AAGK32_08040, partial [Actinomycetota bacterium]